VTLHPADAASLLVEAAENGGSAVVAILVGGNSDALAATRIARIEGAGAEPRVHGSLGTARLDEAAITVMKDVLSDPRSSDGLRELTVDGAVLELYLEIRRPVRELIIVGAGHIAQPLSHLGALLGFRVSVLDDRPDFATRERFPDADNVFQADFEDPFRDTQLHEHSHVLLVTRGHKYDYACLVRALRVDPPPSYIGMIGSRRRVRATYVQLLEEGFDRGQLDRIHAPVGLDIGAETPEEIAVSVAAELVKVGRGGTGAPLREVERVAERFFSDGDEEKRATEGMFPERDDET
jgi:xanthine dehydrogenase accessory factor